MSIGNKDKNLINRIFKPIYRVSFHIKRTVLSMMNKTAKMSARKNDTKIIQIIYCAKNSTCGVNITCIAQKLFYMIIEAFNEFYEMWLSSLKQIINFINNMKNRKQS